MKGNAIESLRRHLERDPFVANLRKIPFKGGVYLVGGAIREILIGRIPKDYDFVISERCDIEVFERFLNAKSFVIGKKPFQTRRMICEDKFVDINFIEGRIEDDLQRRDFTINAIAFDIKKAEIIDPYSGIEDIKKKVIRYPLRKNLKEDPLRMIKAVRHFASLKGFDLTEELKDAIKEDRSLIKTVSKERIKYELDRIILSEDPFKGFKLLAETELLFEIFPELHELRKMDEEERFELEIFGHTIFGFKYLDRERSFYAFSEKDVLWVGYALLFHDLGKPETLTYDEKKAKVHFFYHEKISKGKAKNIMERLKFSNEDTRKILQLIENHMRVFLIATNESSIKALRRLVIKMGDLTPHLLLLSKCDMYGSSKGRKNISTKRVESTCFKIMDVFEELKREPVKCLINGYDLIALGFKEGPAVGRVLKEILDMQISGKINNKEDALDYARRFLDRCS